MSERYHALTIVFGDEVNDEDAEHFASLVGLLRGVASVQLHPAGHEYRLALRRAKAELRNKLHELLQDEP
jgi:hypothetical protein